MGDLQLSRAAYERIKEEHEDLTTRGRVEIAGLIEKARALGDLKENGDYHAAKDQQGKMEARIRQIEAMLKTAEIVETDNTEVVSTGHIIGIRYEGDDDIEKYLLGNLEERPEDMALISPDSPLGQALLGKTVGQTVEYEAPNGKLKVEIVEISAP